MGVEGISIYFIYLFSLFHLFPPILVRIGFDLIIMTTTREFLVFQLIILDRKNTVDWLVDRQFRGKSEIHL